MRMFSRWSRQQRRVLLPTHVAAFKEAVMKMMMMMMMMKKVKRKLYLTRTM
jgi:hypothetical protein